MENVTDEENKVECKLLMLECAKSKQSAGLQSCEEFSPRSMDDRESYDGFLVERAGTELVEQSGPEAKAKQEERRERYCGRREERKEGRTDKRTERLCRFGCNSLLLLLARRFRSLGTRMTRHERGVDAANPFAPVTPRHVVRGCGRT